MYTDKFRIDVPSNILLSCGGVKVKLRVYNKRWSKKGLSRFLWKTLLRRCRCRL